MSEGVSALNSTAPQGAVSTLAASPMDYIALLKPRVMSLVVFTALAGTLIASNLYPQISPHPVLLAVAVFCIAIGAGASGALNMWVDRDIDPLMKRTQNRPIPAGRIEASEALSFGLMLSAGSVFVMGVAIGWLAAVMLAFTIFFYVVVYSIWLKRSTPQNIVIGGAAGAFPPMIGWTAVTGTLSLESSALFLMIFFWTPPHFWALSLLKTEEYAKAGIPMLPVVAGIPETLRQIVLYSWIYVVSTSLPLVLGFAGLGYALVALVLGGVFLIRAYALARSQEPERAGQARALFAFSILNLFALFATLMLEHGFKLPLFPSLLAGAL